MDFTATVPSDPVATALLSAYFTSRELSFSGEQGYQIVFPGDKQFEPPHGVFLVASVNGATVGCGGVRKIDHGDGGLNRFEVKHLWVDAASRGTGFGRQILAELERRAIELGATEAVLDTNASLEAAAGLYHSSGYRSISAYNNNPNATNWYAKSL